MSKFKLGDRVHITKMVGYYVENPCQGEVINILSGDQYQVVFEGFSGDENRAMYKAEELVYVDDSKSCEEHVKSLQDLMLEEV